MKGRTARLKTIETIIHNHHISSQEELLTHLESSGFEVTQGTLSRDLRLLRVGKVSDPEKGYYYSLPGEEDVTDAEFIQDFLRAYLSMEASQNLVVIKTLPGHAGSLAWALDNLELTGVIGTLAGDDTVLVILKENYDFIQFKQALKDRVPGWEV